MKTHPVAGSVLFFSRAGVARTALALYTWRTPGTAEANGRTNGAQRCSRRDSVPKRFIPPGTLSRSNHSCDSTGPGGWERQN